MIQVEMLLSLTILDYRVLIPLTQTQKGIVDEKDRLQTVYYCISLTRSSRTVLGKNIRLELMDFHCHVHLYPQKTCVDSFHFCVNYTALCGVCAL